MTIQELFSRVRAHLLSQGRKSTSVGGDVCLYRGEGNLRCAIGCLIPDEMYSTDLEGKLADAEIILNLCGLEPDQAGLAFSLQSAHDHALVCQWPAKLAEVARVFGLENV